MSILAQEPLDVKLYELVARANTLILALAADEDEDSPVGRAVVDWLRDAENLIGPAEECGCVLPGQHCPACDAIASIIYSGDAEPALDSGWWGDPIEGACG